MKLVYFTHALTSCWNHGNAHFLRGVLREMMLRGWDVLALQPRDSWSVQNLLRDHGDAGLVAFRQRYPGLACKDYAEEADLAPALDGADLVIVHEWNEAWLVAALGQARRRGARFTLLFHDTHHRAVSDPAAIRHFDLNGYDGVLAFGAALAQVYRRWGWGDRVFTWHEAADTALFRPPAHAAPRRGLVWIGNWGDEERSEELMAYLLRPARSLGLPLDVHGVRYPEAARQALSMHGARYCGWLANAEVPGVFAQHIATVHVPRRFYVEALPGIPTIRVFEALACGIPLLSAPWHDAEQLFRPGADFLMGRDPDEMLVLMRAVAADPALRASLAAQGLATIQARHSCAHRAEELLAILARLRPQQEAAA